MFTYDKRRYKTFFKEHKIVVTVKIRYDDQRSIKYGKERNMSKFMLHVRSN